MKFKALLNTFCHTTQHTGYRRDYKPQVANSVTVTHNPKRNCELGPSVTMFHDFYFMEAEADKT